MIIEAHPETVKELEQVAKFYVCLIGFMSDY